ncbi:hypothetical protein BGW80DRAFT_592207 [Lactifluus volemus]|nr:hypothetical protein BGW80DRAFT_592207 [Lactifluus volemus]
MLSHRKEVNKKAQVIHICPMTPISKNKYELAVREATLNPPIKRQRLNNGLVQIVHSAPAPNRVRHTEKLTNVDILSGVLGSNYWRFTFIPTYLQYLSNLEVDNPWAFSDDEVVGLLQMVWDRLYGVKGLHHRVVIGEAVFAVANQHTIEWRNAFASTALSILLDFFDDEEIDSDYDRKDLSEEYLEDYVFLYRDVWENDGEMKRKGIFGDPLITQTFSAHYSMTSGAKVIPVIGDRDKPFLALALSAAAVERALTLWRDGFISCETVAAQKAGKRSSAIKKTLNKSTGQVSRKSTDFNEANWGTATCSYITLIERHLTPNTKKFDRIADEAVRFATSNDSDFGDY